MSDVIGVSQRPADDRGSRSTPTSPAITAAQRWVVPILLLLVLWLATRPYVGITHDGRLYMMQALNSLYPGRFSDDLFFKYGSQDSFSAFSLLYKPVVQWLGVGWAHMAMTVAGQALWFAAALGLLLAFFKDRRTAFAAMLGVALLDPGYGAFGIFRYGEPFATPRLFAEAGVMAALMAALRGRHILAWAVLALACAVHPLMGATGAAVLGATYLKDRRTWVALAAGLAVALVCALGHWGPFGRLFLRFDDAWFEVVKRRCDFAFLTAWHPQDWCRLAALSAMLAVFASLADAKERMAIVLVGACGLASLVLTFLGADVGRDILIVNIQSWRMLWLWTLLSNAAAALILLRLPKTGAARILFASSFAINMVSTFVGTPSIILSLLTLFSCGIFCWEHIKREPQPRFMIALLLLLPAAAAAAALFFLWLNSHTGHFWNTVIDCLIAGSAALLLCVSFRRLRTLTPWIAIVLLVLTVVRFDQRDDWDRMAESSVDMPEFDRFLSGAGRVYWEDDIGLKMVWIKAMKPSYYSCFQGTGVMFYRGTALDYQRRSNALRKLNTSDFSSDSDYWCMTKSNPAADGPSGQSQLVEACRALPDMDSIILMHPVAGAPARRQWGVPVHLTLHKTAGQKERIQTFYQYRCAELG